MVPSAFIILLCSSLIWIANAEQEQCTTTCIDLNGKRDKVIKKVIENIGLIYEDPTVLVVDLRNPRCVEGSRGLREVMVVHYMTTAIPPKYTKALQMTATEDKCNPIYYDILKDLKSKQPEYVPVGSTFIYPNTVAGAQTEPTPNEDLESMPTENSYEIPMELENSSEISEDFDGTNEKSPVIIANSKEDGSSSNDYDDIFHVTSGMLYPGLFEKFQTKSTDYPMGYTANPFKHHKVPTNTEASEEIFENAQEEKEDPEGAEDANQNEEEESMDLVVTTSSELQQQEIEFPEENAEAHHYMEDDSEEEDVACLIYLPKSHRGKLEKEIQQFSIGTIPSNSRIPEPEVKNIVKYLYIRLINYYNAKRTRLQFEHRYIYHITAEFFKDLLQYIQPWYFRNDREGFYEVVWILYSRVFKFYSHAFRESKNRGKLLTIHEFLVNVNHNKLYQTSFLQILQSNYKSEFKSIGSNEMSGLMKTSPHPFLINVAAIQPTPQRPSPQRFTLPMYKEVVDFLYPLAYKYKRNQREAYTFISDFYQTFLLKLKEKPFTGNTDDYFEAVGKAFDEYILHSISISNIRFSNVHPAQMDPRTNSRDARRRILSYGIDADHLYGEGLVPEDDATKPMNERGSEEKPKASSRGLGSSETSASVK